METSNVKGYILTDAKLAEIEAPGVYGVVALSVRLNRVASSHRLLAARLAEAERAYEVISADRHSIEEELFTARESHAARLATAEGTIAELRAHVDLTHAELAKFDADLALERERRIAAEAREAELRAALTMVDTQYLSLLADSSFDHRKAWPNHLSGLRAWIAALVSPGSTASAVLAAAEEVGALLDSLDSDKLIAACFKWQQAVRAWRKGESGV